jgi:hypothetical protein
MQMVVFNLQSIQMILTEPVYYFSGELEFRFNSDFTFNAKVYSGLDQTTYSELITENPYFNNTPLIDHQYSIADISAYIYYHPTTEFGMTAGINYDQVERMMMFNYDTLGSFNMFL